MKYIRQIIEGDEVHIYPLPCWHIGAKQSYRPFIETVVNEIKNDEKARFVYMGDMGECVTKASKGNIYEQTMSPGDQLRVGVELLADVRDKGLFGVRGNHGNRVDKDSGVGWDELFCARLGIPYMGVSSLSTLSFKFRGHKHADYNVSMYAHHGSESGTSPASKLNAAHKPEAFIMADLLLTAHSHACSRAFPDKVYAYANHHTGQIEYGTCRSYICGSAYDSRSGYAEEKMYSPIIPEHVVIKVKVKRDRSNGKDVLFHEISDKRIYLDARTSKVVVEESF